MFHNVGTRLRRSATGVCGGEGSGKEKKREVTRAEENVVGDGEEVFAHIRQG